MFLYYTIDEIQNMSKEQIKKKVKESMKKVAFEYLNTEKNRRSKIQNINYNEF